MNEKVLRVLEYHKIIARLTEKATSEPGKKRAAALLPMTDLNEIQAAQTQTADALGRLFAKGSTSFGSNKDFGMSLKSLEVGSVLSIAELLRIASFLENVNRIKAYGRRERDDMPGDSLDVWFDMLEPLTPLAGEINRCILSEEEIADDASPALKHIRRSMAVTNDRIHSQLNSMINGSLRTYLQDAVVTMRDNRYCIPVKSEYKSQVPGMVHDQSSTGSTFFIEPAAVVNLNNELKELSIREKEEIEAVLASLSAQTAAYTRELATDQEAMTNLDFVFAKAALAMEQNAIMPLFNTEHQIHIRKGRHPLLDPKKVVPIDVILGDDFNLLIVTGPNTGGKTVSLKTVGLLTLMGQAGLHIPAGDRSELRVFQNVFADIGDEQSIEQNLSTFSSHMTNIVSILSKADQDSLVLFDELCAGTDPTEGAALAISILTRLHNQNVCTMATTHYSEIKVFALSTEGVENASCEFDVETLSPTYRLLIGIPGKSNAFAISGKIGLDADLIEDAKSRITESQASFEDLISDLENSRVTIEKEQAEINAYKEQISSLKQKLEQKQERIDQSREKILREANEQAYNIIKEAKDIADESIRNFNKFGQIHAPASEMERERAKLRDKMSGHEKQLAAKKEPPANNKVPKNLRIGDSVKVLSMNLKGTVSSLPNAKGDLTVQMGILNSTVNIRDLVLLEDETSPSSKKFNKSGTGKIKMSKSSSVSTEINLIGMTVDEALAHLDKYLDDAYIAHLPSVRIVHGKGTGALRKAVQQHLKRQKYVKTYHLGEFGEGDSGVTIAEFK